jgi:hypothetical protein
MRGNADDDKSRYASPRSFIPENLNPTGSTELIMPKAILQRFDHLLACLLERSVEAVREPELNDHIQQVFYAHLSVALAEGFLTFRQWPEKRTSFFGKVTAREAFLRSLAFRKLSLAFIALLSVCFRAYRWP